MQNVFLIVCAIIASLAVRQDGNSRKWQWNVVRRGAYLFVGAAIPLSYYRIYRGAENFTSALFWGLVLLYVVTVGVVLLLPRLVGWAHVEFLSSLNRMKR